jgi:Fe-S-cluster-containing hydrogenase component 2
MVCPHGAVKTIMSQEKAFKCTLQCGVKKEPACVLACDRGALTFEEVPMQNKKRRRAKIKELPRK